VGLLRRIRTVTSRHFDNAATLRKKRLQISLELASSLLPRNHTVMAGICFNFTDTVNHGTRFSAKPAGSYSPDPGYRKVTAKHSAV
jgi:hypothetical protein